MTDNTPAPERIWLLSDRFMGAVWEVDPNENAEGLEYVRADLFDAQRGLLHDLRISFVAMRNSINEVIPMQSEDSEILESAEPGFSFEVVARAVVDHITDLRGENGQIKLANAYANDTASAAIADLKAMTANADALAASLMYHKGAAKRVAYDEAIKADRALAHHNQLRQGESK